MNENPKRTSAIIIKDRKILLIHRKKEGKEYWVFPGGGIEDGESPEDAVVREVLEETSLKVSCKENLYEWFEQKKKIKHPFYLCEVIGSIEPKLSGPEKERCSENNWYQPEWIKLDSIYNLTLYPEEVKDFILDNRDFLESVRRKDLSR